MRDEISPELFEHLVELAALELEPEEGEYLRRELNNQLAAVRVLEGIRVPPGTEPAARGVPYPPERAAPVREDVVIGCEEREAILSQAPELDGGYIVVPETAHEELA